MSRGTSDAPLMLGVSGLRGIVGRSLTPEIAARFACAFGSWLRDARAFMFSEHADAPRPFVLVGRDGRAGGEAIYWAAVSGLLSSGFDVVPVGVVMTPTLGHEVDRTGAHGAIMVTASHNPQEWNGLKCIVPGNEDERAGASAPPPHEADAIVQRFTSGRVSWRTPGRIIPSKSLHELGPTGDHAEWAARNRALDGVDPGAFGGFVAVVDSVNASGAAATSALFRELGARCVQLFGDDSGVFPHAPEPTAENLAGAGGLCDAVPGLKADIGFAQDPDGDRLAIIDEHGRFIGEEYTLALCAENMLLARAWESNLCDEPDSAENPDVEDESSDEPEALPPVFVVNLSTSRMIDDVAARHGAEVVRTPVGEANVVARMKELMDDGREVLLGGEGNGGVIWPDVCSIRDSLSAMAMVLALMARTGRPISRLVADLPSYAILKRKQPLASKADARPALERIAAAYASERIDTQDGVRVDFDRLRAWVHVRASNTEPILRLIAEAQTPEVAGRILDEAAAIVGS